MDTEPLRLPDLLLGYLAGVFDSEGTVCIGTISREHPGTWSHLGVRIGVVMSDDGGNGAVPLFAATFGCGIRSDKRKEARPMLVWQATRWRAVRVLRTLQPHLRVKQRQAALAIEFMTTVHQGHRRGRQLLPPDVVATRLRIRDEIAVLNHSHWRRRRIARQRRRVST